jgi:hypothetical protein
MDSKGVLFKVLWTVKVFCSKVLCSLVNYQCSVDMCIQAVQLPNVSLHCNYLHNTMYSTYVVVTAKKCFSQGSMDSVLQ